MTTRRKVPPEVGQEVLLDARANFYRRASELGFNPHETSHSWDHALGAEVGDHRVASHELCIPELAAKFGVEPTKKAVIDFMYGEGAFETMEATRQAQN